MNENFVYILRPDNTKLAPFSSGLHRLIFFLLKFNKWLIFSIFTHVSRGGSKNFIFASVKVPIAKQEYVVSWL